MRNINIVTAIGKGGVIGLNNKLPWHIPSELKVFKTITEDRNVVMGYNTYLSLGKPLPNRTNFVVTRREINIPGCIVVQDLSTISLSQEPLYIIGGQRIYEIYSSFADTFYISYIHDYYGPGDAYFPRHVLDYVTLNFRKSIFYIDKKFSTYKFSRVWDATDWY